VSAIPELAAHLRENAAQYAIALAAENSGVVAYVNVHASRFIRELGNSVAAGFVLTLDYGDTSWGLIQGARRGDFPFRVYGEWQDYVPRPNDPYRAPGTQDLTADVNFTELARAAESAGLKVIHYGPERDITGDALPELLLRHQQSEALARFLGNPVFKMLVVGTRGSVAFRSPLATPLSLLAREQDVPPSRRAAIAAIQAALSGY
jgi:SAM-dependent MidA family methyltransferase